MIGDAVESARQPSAVRSAPCAARYPRLRGAMDGKRAGVMRIVVFPGVLRPPSDAALLGRVMARDAERLRGREVLDLCSGTGILGLTAARLGARATAVDLSRRAVVNARLNARLNGLELSVLRGDLFAPVEDRRFDLIVSNPPYIPAPPGDAPRGAARAWDAGPDGRAFLDPSATRPPATCALVAGSCSCTRASPRPRSQSAASPRPGWPRRRRPARRRARAGGPRAARLPALDRRGRRLKRRADGGRRGAPGVSEAVGRHAVALASVTALALRAGAQRVVLLVDEGDTTAATMIEWAGGALELTEEGITEPVAPAAIAQVGPALLPESAGARRGAGGRPGDGRAGRAARRHRGAGGRVIALAGAFGGRSVATAEFATREPEQPFMLAARPGEPIVAQIGGETFAFPEGWP